MKNLTYYDNMDYSDKPVSYASNFDCSIKSFSVSDVQVIDTQYIAKKLK